MVNKLAHFSEKGILKFLVFLACLLIIPFLSLRLQTDTALLGERLLFVPPQEYLSNIRGGFRNLLADVYYIKGVLAVTDEFNSRQERISWTQQVFKAAVLLDKDMLQAYFFAGSAIVNSKEELKQGNEFLILGLTNSPAYWQIPYWIGFNYYLIGDSLKAAEFYRLASQRPGAPNFLKSNQAMLFYKAGEPRMGLMYLEGLLESVSDPEQLKWVKLKIEWLKNMIVLQDAVESFKDRYNRLPQDLEELISRRLISSVPKDPFGGGYYLDDQSGKIKSSFGMPTKVKTTPEKPAESGEGCSKCKK